MEQEVQHARSARDLGESRGGGRADAGERVDGAEQRCEQFGQGLTGDDRVRAPAYMTGAPQGPDVADRPDPSLDTRRRRILFRATHRGTHENDLLIGRFVAARLAGFGPEELDSIEALMELPDVMLADWLTGRVEIPAGQDTPMLRAMRAAAMAGEARAR
jgi:antitoxin CptB